MTQKIAGIFNLIPLIIICSLIAPGCSKDEEKPSAEELLRDGLAKVDTVRLKADIAIIEDSLAQWSITALSEPHGVRYTIETQGSGPKPTLNGAILVNYRGKLLKNNSVFDQGSSVAMRLSGLILGWQTTLPLINKGSKVTLYIPSGLAYGTGIRYDNDGNVSIPANSNLVFEIEILDVQ
jgi:hypothetical protein